jgi:hypothetical protein
MQTSKLKKLFLFLLAVCCVLLCLAPAQAWADPTLVLDPISNPAATPTALQSLTEQIMAVLVPAFTVLIGSLAAWILAKVKDKLHIDIAQTTIDAWTELAKSAAARAGEWARTKTEALEGNAKIPGGETMDTAVAWAVEMAKQHKLPEMERAKLIGLIEAELFKQRPVLVPVIAPTDPYRPDVPSAPVVAGPVVTDVAVAPVTVLAPLT